MIIACWSPIQGHCAVTTNMCLISAYMAFQKQKSLLCMDSHDSSGQLKNILYSDGMDELGNIFTYAKSNNLTPKNMKLYSSQVVNDRLFVVGATEQKLVKDSMDDAIYKTVLECAEEAFEYVFVDTCAGNNTESTKSILKYCDFIIVNLPQDDFIIRKYLAKAEGYWSPHIDEKKHIHIIGNYKSHYEHQSIRRINRLYMLDNLLYIPEDKYLHKAVMECRFLQWFSQGLRRGKSDNNVIYHNIDKACEHILELPKKRGMFSKLREKVSEYGIINTNKASIF